VAFLIGCDILDTLVCPGVQGRLLEQGIKFLFTWRLSNPPSTADPRSLLVICRSFLSARRASRACYVRFVKTSLKRSCRRLLVEFLFVALVKRLQGRALPFCTG